MTHPPGAFPLSSWFTARLVSSRVGGQQLTGGPHPGQRQHPRETHDRGSPHDTTAQSSQPIGPGSPIPSSVSSDQPLSQGGGLEKRNVRVPLSAGRESVDHKWLSRASQTLRTCVSLSLLTAHTTSRFNSKFCPVNCDVQMY